MGKNSRAPGERPNGPGQRNEVLQLHGPGNGAAVAGDELDGEVSRGVELRAGIIAVRITTLPCHAEIQRLKRGEIQRGRSVSLEKHLRTGGVPGDSCRPLGSIVLGNAAYDKLHVLGDISIGSGVGEIIEHSRYG